jgi:general secretion pathway protein D
VQLNGVTLEQALSQILSANQLFYKVINDRTIMVIADNPQKRANYEEQVIRTFYVSHADATELAQTINTIIRVPAMAVQPMVSPNKTNNTITIRATTAVAAIIEKMIDSNDKPRAES